jgi:hypothetical protein
VIGGWREALRHVRAKRPNSSGSLKRFSAHGHKCVRIGDFGLQMRPCAETRQAAGRPPLGSPLRPGAKDQERLITKSRKHVVRGPNHNPWGPVESGRPAAACPLGLDSALAVACFDRDLARLSLLRSGARLDSVEDIKRLRQIVALLNEGLNLAGIGMVLRLEADNARLRRQISAERDRRRRRLMESQIATPCRDSGNRWVERKSP